MNKGLDPHLITGIKIIDAQHHQLFARVDLLLGLAMEDAGIDQYVETFAFFSRYVHYHFDTEERFMTKHAYDRAAYHVSQHVWFKAELATMLIAIQKEGMTPSQTTRFNYLVFDWFRNHVLTVDKKMTGFLKDKVKSDANAPAAEA